MRLITTFFLLLSCNLIFGQFLSEDEKLSLEKNAIAISPTCSDDDLSFLIDLVGTKKMVMLGEFDHRVKETNLIKNRMIRYLHENLGFDVILFESGIGELISTDMHRDILTGDQMTYGLFGYWRSPEFSNLMNYIKESNNISVAGFDVQRTGRSFDQYLKEMNVLSMAPTEFDVLENGFTEAMDSLMKGDLNDKLVQVVDSLINNYSSLAEIWSDAGFESLHERIAIKTLYNRIAHLQYFLEFKKTNDYNTRWNDRDSLMAENVRFLVEDIYPDQKFIVLGHNYHLSKYNEDLKVMGEYLNDQSIGYVSIGVFGGTGELGFNDDVKVLTPPNPEQLDLKHLISKIPFDYAFCKVNVTGTTPFPWFSEPIVVNDTFINLSGRNYLTIGKHFDGLVLIKKVSPVTSID